MRYDPAKCFGYPVLRPPSPDAAVEDGDYGAAGFHVKVNAFFEVKEAPAKIHIDYKFLFSLEVLREKIAAGDATCFLRVECEDTYLAKNEEVRNEGSLTLHADDLHGKVTISGFVLARNETEIVSDRINPEFGDDKFVAKSGQVLALDEPKVYYVHKDNLRPAKSLFRFSPGEGLRNGEFRVDLNDEEYVLIRCSREQARELEKAIEGASGRSIFDNSLVLSAMTDVLTKLREDELREDGDGYADCRWAQVLMSKYPEWRDDDPLVRAQKILNYPLGRLGRVFDEIGEK